MKETHNIEFKESWRDEYIKYVSGFANAHGGTLYVGVDDKGNVVGVKDAVKLLEDLPNKISLTTGLVVDVNLLNEDVKEYISITVVQSAMPVSFKGKYYYRSGSTLQELHGIAAQNFIMNKMGISWDSQIVEGATLDDIDPEAVKYFVESGIANRRLKASVRNDSMKKILSEIDVITVDGKVSMAALLLFGKNPQKYCLNSRFKIGWFGDGTAELKAQDLIGGDLIRMADRVMDVLDQKYLVRPIHYDGMRRIEPLEIPEKGIREILYNAIAHKAYDGPDIQMKVYYDRINLWNYGSLPNGYTFDAMFKEHKSMPRNKLIANAFFFAGFVEAWGRGFEIIKASFKSEGLQIPIFREEFHGVTVEIMRERFLAMKGDDMLNVTEDDVINLSERQKVILNLLPKDVTANVTVNVTVNSEAMAIKLGVTSRTIKRDLKILQESGLIRRIGSDKTGYWVVVTRKWRQD